MAHIVVAEDDADIREIMVRVLRRAGHTVTETEDGAAALDAVREKRPDLVVSDIDMPHLSGVDLSLAIRHDPATGDLPVIFVSGSLLAGDPRPGEGQATAVLLKPFRPGELRDCVDRVLAGGPHPGQGPVAYP